ncbi:hypothetical protein Trisim1_005906 [Trichoderma cf. simile WF8]
MAMDARAKAINAIFIKAPNVAIRDDNPIRAIISVTATNFDGKTAGVTHLAVVECYGTRRSVGDPIETAAIARVFEDFGVHITSVMPKLGHGGGASGITSLIKSDPAGALAGKEVIATLWKRELASQKPKNGGRHGSIWSECRGSVPAVTCRRSRDLRELSQERNNFWRCKGSSEDRRVHRREPP